MQLTFPGPDAPAPPVVSFAMPEGWHPIVTPGSVLSAAKQVEADVFTANAMVTWVRESSEFLLEEAVRLLEVELRAQPDCSMLEPIEAGFDGLHGVGRGAVFTQPGVGALAQFHVMLLAPGHGYSDLVHMTVTIGGDRVAEDFPEVRDLLHSIRVNVAVGTS